VDGSKAQSERGAADSRYAFIGRPYRVKLLQELMRFKSTASGFHARGTSGRHLPIIGVLVAAVIARRHGGRASRSRTQRVSNHADAIGLASQNFHDVSGYLPHGDSPMVPRKPVAMPPNGLVGAGVFMSRTFSSEQQNVFDLPTDSTICPSRLPKVIAARHAAPDSTTAVRGATTLAMAVASRELWAATESSSPMADAHPSRWHASRPIPASRWRDRRHFANAARLGKSESVRRRGEPRAATMRFGTTLVGIRTTCGFAIIVPRPGQNASQFDAADLLVRSVWRFASWRHQHCPQVDGSVGFLSYTVDATVWRNFCTIADGNPLQPDSITANAGSWHSALAFPVM
jgi:hypothetical protein